MDERGQVTPLLAVVVLAIGGLVFGLARFGGTVTHAAQAQAAADAAALAGAAEGRDAAGAVATANGAELASYEELGADVQVRARVGDTWAVARARRTRTAGAVGWVGERSATGAGARLPATVRAVLAAAAALLDQPVPVVRLAGTAVDVPGSFAARLADVAPRVGLCRRAGSSDPVRFELCPPTRA